MKELQEKCKKQLPETRFNEPLYKYSTFQIGGPADFFYKATDTEQLLTIIEFCKQEKIPTLFIGGGSNILFDDKGFRGFVVKIENKQIIFEDDIVVADAGVLVSILIREVMKNKLSGIEKWIGLPGTVGGAIRGNAGCNGLETKDILISASVLDTKSNKIKELKNAELNFSYRSSFLKKNTNLIVLKGTFQLEKNKMNENEQKEIMKQIMGERGKKQPYGLSAGSFFKNPSPGKSAGMLIEKAGLKGKTIGGAKISEKHANFFVNIGGASSQDIITLASIAKREVKAKFGVLLEEEVQIVKEKND
jgi:UDP-N-acetylmuramate dehydrogenase